MKIAIVGLGLIGGSLAKAAKQHGEYCVYGLDIDPAVCRQAQHLQAIDREGQTDDLQNCELVILALHPLAAEEWLRQNADKLRQGSLLVDCCGTKRRICELGFSLAQRYGFYFIGGHPMAGIERSGFEASNADLFKRAAMILTPEEKCPTEVLEFAKNFFLGLGFNRITVTNAKDHDRIIALTSQLAHVVSSSYLRSPTAAQHEGYSAGSFRDMTRVAWLHEGMWTELFLQNSDFLCSEIELLIANLRCFQELISQQQEEQLRQHLKEGRLLKEKIMPI
ncbi:MAG: prephenate dehydrogenase [Oligosphaeraceae bacterium]|nr:prephenate dehydrogenase [Oligosphaeraceae bacterium]